MKTYERLEALRDWTYETCCRGKLMKAPAKGMNVAEVVRQEPKVFIAYYPIRKDADGYGGDDAFSTVPSILIMPTESYTKYVQVFRKDNDVRGVNRPQDIGQGLHCQILFSVFEDGTRLPGFTDTAKAGKFDMSLIKEGTQDGLRTLLYWMDEFKENMLGTQVIPGTDMMLQEASFTYGLHTDGGYVSDKRPIFYGMIEVGFTCHADHVPNRTINKLLD